MTRQGCKKSHDSATNQGLSPGETQLFYPLRDKGAAQPIELFQAQEVGFRQESHVFRHAIDATEIAAVRDGYPQIPDSAPEGVH